MRDQQKLSFLVLNRNLENRISSGPQLRGPPGIEWRPDTPPQSLQKAVTDDCVPKTAFAVNGTTLPQLLEMIPTDLKPLLDVKGDMQVQPTKNSIQLNRVLRLVKPAILSYEERGKLKQVPVLLEVQELAALCLDKRLALLQYILDLRLLLWLVQHIHLHAFSSGNYAGRSLLFREAHAASAWDFWHSCSGIEIGLSSPAQHLWQIFTGSDTSRSLKCILKRLPLQLRNQLRDATRLGRQKRNFRVQQLVAATILRREQQTESEEARMELTNIEKMISELRTKWGSIQWQLFIERMIFANQNPMYPTMFQKQRVQTTPSRQPATGMCGLQARVVMLTCRISDLEFMAKFLTVM